MLDYYATLLKDVPLFCLLLFGGIALLSLCIHTQWARAGYLLLVVVIGTFLCEVLKTGFERARPSVIPTIVEGNSYPSGHAMGALLLTGVLIVLRNHLSIATWLKRCGGGLLLLFTGAILWQRIYLAHHWLSDISGSLLLSMAWLGLTLPATAYFRRKPASLILLGLGLLICYQCFYFLPQLRVRLPSAHNVQHTEVLTLSFGKEAPADALQGSWETHTREPLGPISWARRGEAAVVLPLSRLNVDTLQFIARPFVQSKNFACYPVEMDINGHAVTRLLLYRGWRVYSIPLRQNWLRLGKNIVTFHTKQDFPTTHPKERTMALHVLHVLSEAPK